MKPLTSKNKIIKWPDGTWFYGNFVNGKRHGSGSILADDGNYYDMEFSYEEIESSQQVDSPPLRQS